MKYILAFILSISMFACSDSQEKQAAQFADTFAHSISAVHAAVDAAHTTGKLTDANYQSILKDILAADQGGLDLNTTIRGIAAGTTTTAQLNSVVQEIESALTDGAAHIQDHNTLAQVQTAISAINLTLTSIESIYGGK